MFFCPWKIYWNRLLDLKLLLYKTLSSNLRRTMMRNFQSSLLFFYGFSFAYTKDSPCSWGRDEPIFNSFNHFHWLTNNQTFICSFAASEMIIFPANIRLDEDVWKTSFVFVFKRRLQDVLIKTNIFVFAICLQDVLKTFSRYLAKESLRHLQDVLQKMSLQDLFKTYHQIKLFFLTRLREVFNTFLRRTAKTIICRGICLGHTSEKFMISVQNLQGR